MRPWVEYLETVATLLAVVEPIALIPLFLAATKGMGTAGRLRTSLTAAVTMFTVLTVAILVGERLFHAFGIGIPSFRVGGGIVLLIIAIQLILGPTKSPQEEGLAPDSRFGVVPLGVPLLAGPGAITAVLIQSQDFTSALDTGILIGCVALVGLLVFLCYALAEPLGRMLGEQGIDVIGRVLSLILAAMAIEFIASGLSEIFPALGARVR